MYLENLKNKKESPSGFITTRLHGSTLIESKTNRYDFLVAWSGSGLTVEIREIQVNSDRRKGIGRGLIQELEKQLKGTNWKRIWAITREENKIAQEFYRALGFKQSGLLDQFYPDGSAYIFWKEI